ncbi:MAG: sigma-54-dependent transcriptional regulator [Thermoanaerobaculia bacterium]
MSESLPAVLIVDDEFNSRTALEALVRREGFEPVCVSTLAEAETEASRRPFAAVLVDYYLPDGAGLELIERLEEPRPEFVLVTGKSSVELAVEALRAGVVDYLEKPVDQARLKSVLEALLRTGTFRQEIRTLRDELRELGRFGAMIGTSPPMQALYDLLERVAPSDATILLRGESGTGKELVAGTVHRLSRRSHRPFEAINCGAISGQLIESELFGHERGSFTGAEKQRRGVFERAHTGTLFLDEISEMPIELQVKLLRVLETQSFTRVGGERPIQVDVRIVAASNRDLEAATREGKFREDLLYRLRVVDIELPPLRERGEDIGLLAERFLAEFARERGRAQELSPDAIAELAGRSWPGNVRELRNAIQQASILADGIVEPEHLPAGARDEGSPALRREPGAGATGGGAPQGDSVRIAVPATLADAERRIILATLEALDGNKAATAKQLGISLKTLYSRLREYSARDER